MATVSATPTIARTQAAAQSKLAERVHRVFLTLAIMAAAGLVVFLTAHGIAYYALPLEERPFSPLHSQLRSSGSIGLRLGILSLGMFFILFLYPIRKRWKWLAGIGSTRRWLNFHVFFGIATPCVVTFHTSFRFHGIAGLAYWTMIAVALSGFVGRYVYAKIPHSLNSVALTISDLESQAAALAAKLKEQELFRAADVSPLLNVPSPQEVRAMNLLRTLWTMLAMDVVRPFQLASLRRRVLSWPQCINTLGGLLPSHNREVEAIVTVLRRQSRLLGATAFLHRTERIFHLWHVVHRPFSISFVALIAVHIFVALSVGF